jgi:hypothetical protein
MSSAGQASGRTRNDLWPYVVEKWNPFLVVVE